MLIDQRPQALWHREDQMSIRHARVQHSLHSLDPLLPIHLRTRQAELAFAAERHQSSLLAIRTQIDCIPIRRIPTAQHLLHHSVHSFVAWMLALERLPAINEDLLEAVLVDVTGRRHAPQSSQSVRLCQTRSQPEVVETEASVSTSHSDL